MLINAGGESCRIHGGNGFTEDDGADFITTCLCFFMWSDLSAVTGRTTARFHRFVCCACARDMKTFLLHFCRVKTKNLLLSIKRQTDFFYFFR